MELWTWQGATFDLYRECYDSNKAYYSDDPKIMAAYKKIHQALKTSNFIWCSLKDGDNGIIPQDDYPRVLWHFRNVPDTSILGYVDSILWNELIEHIRLPKWNNFIAELPHKYHDAEAIKNTVSNYQQMDQNAQWAKLLEFKKPSHTRIDILVKLPIQKEWEIHRQLQDDMRIPRNFFYRSPKSRKVCRSGH